MKYKINILIVIYNKSLKNSITVQSICRIPNIHVIIADNSTSNFYNCELAYKLGFDYIDMNGNQGLSKAYNKAISMLEKNDDIICLYDDDTQVCEQYFFALDKAIQEHENMNIFAPLVQDKVGLLSPCIIRDLTGIRVKSVNDIPQGAISVINSGLAVRLKVFKDYQYDESQFLDYIDHAFIRDIARNNKSMIYIMEDVILEQRFSGVEKSSLKDELIRFRIFKNDITYYCHRYDISNYTKRKFLLKKRYELLKKYVMPELH